MKIKKKIPSNYYDCRIGVGGAKNRSFLGGVGVGLLRTLVVGIGYFIRLRKSNLFTFTSHSSGISVEMDFKTFIETENSFCIPRLALIASCYKLLTAKLHLRYVKESGAGVGNFVKVGNFRKIQVGVDVGVGHFTSDATSLVLTVSRFVLQYMVKMHPFQNCESRCSKFNAYEKSTAAVFNSF